jgi:hypothetical protein
MLDAMISMQAPEVLPMPGLLLLPLVEPLALKIAFGK